MEKYKPLFEGTLKREGYLISYSEDEIILQNPFAIYELNNSFKLGINMHDLLNVDSETYQLIRSKIKDTNDKFNLIRENLYNYVLGQVSEIQQIAAEAKSKQ